MNPLARWATARGSSFILLITAGILIFLVGGPILMLVFTSIRITHDQLPFESDVPFGLDNFVHILTNSQTYDLLATTLIFTLGSLALSLIISATLAWLVERTNLRGRDGVVAILVAGSAVPSLIAGISWSILLNPQNGMVNVVLRGVFGWDGAGPINVYSLPGLILVQTMTMVPITFLLLAGAFRSMDSSLEEAAHASGASMRTTLRRVTLPLMTPALVSAAIYQFVTVIESFDVPLVIGLRGGIRVLSTQVYSDVTGGVLPDYGRASAHAVILTALSLLPLVFYTVIVARQGRYATISGKGYQPRRVDLGRWNRLIGFLVALYILITTILPILVLMWVSVQPFYALPSADSLARVRFDAYAQLLSPSMLGPLANTLVVAVVAAVGTMTLSLAVSWFLVRRRGKLRQLLDILAFLPHAIPGVIIGLTLLLIYITIPLPIYGTIWIIAIGLTTQYVSLGTRITTAGIAQVDRSLEEAAEASGAGWSRTIRRVTLPLVLPSVINGMLLVFVASIRNLSLALMLVAPGSLVLSTLLWSQWDLGHTDEAAALGVLMVMMAISATTIARILGKRSAVAQTASNHVPR